MLKITFRYFSLITDHYRPSISLGNGMSESLALSLVSTDVTPNELTSNISSIIPALGLADILFIFNIDGSAKSGPGSVPISVL